MSLLRGNVAFRRYWSACLVSNTGDQLARTALLIAVYDRHGGRAVALLLLASTVPRSCRLSPARWLTGSTSALMIGCDTAQALTYLAVALSRCPGPSCWR